MSEGGSMREGETETSYTPTPTLLVPHLPIEPTEVVLYRSTPDIPPYESNPTETSRGGNDDEEARDILQEARDQLSGRDGASLLYESWLHDLTRSFVELSVTVHRHTPDIPPNESNPTETIQGEMSEGGTMGEGETSYNPTQSPKGLTSTNGMPWEELSEFVEGEMGEEEMGEGGSMGGETETSYNPTQPKQRAKTRFNTIMGLSEFQPRLAPNIPPNQYNPSETSRGGNVDNEKARYIINYVLEHDTMLFESLFSSACIHRVPENLRNMNDSAYTPQFITIGPGHSVPQSHARIKVHYAKRLFLRLTEEILDPVESERRRNELLQECVKEMENCVDAARKSYAEGFLDLDEMMMVVDGCFILELLYKYYDLMKTQENEHISSGDSGNTKASGTSQSHEGEGTSKSRTGKKGIIDPIFDSISAANIVRHDLLLLENQLPFFVLQRLFNRTVKNMPNCPYKRSLPEYVLFFFRNTLILESNSKNSDKETTSSSSPKDCVVEVEVSDRGEQPAQEEEKYFHILHLLHQNYLHHEEQKSSSSVKSQGLYSGNFSGFAEKEKQNADRNMEDPSAQRCFRRRRTLVSHKSSTLCESGSKLEEKTKSSDFTISASNLEYGGVRFKPLSGENLFNCKFEEDPGLSWWFRGATFAIPKVSIHDATEIFLRNLIAFEQCCPGISLHYTSYAFLMDMLINSEKDVQVLKDAEVIYNYLGSDEDVSNLFNKLCKGVFLDKFYFEDTCSKAFKYSQYGWPKYLADLKHTYFSSPWVFIGFCLAFLTVGMTVVQFIYGFFK